MDADSYGKLTKEAYVYLLSTQRASGFPYALPVEGRQFVKFHPMRDSYPAHGEMKEKARADNLLC